jgi:excisionase family DNA binding protein
MGWQNEVETERLFHKFSSMVGGDSSAAAMLVLACASISTNAEKPPADACLSVKAVAGRLGVSEGTIRNLVQCGKLAASRIGKGRGTLRFEPADLEAYRKHSSGNQHPIMRHAR